MEINGLLLVDKPLDMTSHDAVNILRRKLGIRKIGHAGTLDPQATGLLIILIGKQATRTALRFSGLDKTYQARLTLGAKTDTADHTGRVTETSDIPDLKSEDIRRVFQQFIGAIAQVPPMVSAKKVKGRKLYQLARKGITVKRDPVRITISDLQITGIAIPDIDFQVRCSKGTYVRTLCEDIGTALGSSAYMNGLRRTAIGGFDVSDAVKVEDIKNITQDKLISLIRDVDTVKP